MADLRQLVSNAKKGERDAFSSLYETVYTDLYRFALYCLNNPSDAEDAVSETVLDAWQELPHLRQEDAFRPWIFRILSAKCKRKMRTYVRRRSESSLEDADIPVAAEFESGESLELRRAMETLSGEERLILSLVVAGGYDSGEAAKLLHMNRNTLRSKQSRALSKLKSILTGE